MDAAKECLRPTENLLCNLVCNFENSIYSQHFKKGRLIPILSVTSMALDKTGTFLYYAQCCGKCIISRINVNEKETPEAEVVYSDFGKTCYNLLT